MLDHLGVVVRGQERLVLPAVSHRQPADEVGQPRIGRSLAFRILVEVIVHIPGFVANPQVVLVGLHQIMEDHEVRDEDLVHPPPGLKAVQVVLGRLGLDVVRLVGEVLAGGMDALALGLEHPGHGVLSQPVDLEVRMQLAQLPGDRHVALGVSEPDRRGDVEGALAARAPARPRARRAAGPAEAGRLDSLGEIAHQQVHLHRIASLRAVARARQAHEGAADQLGERQPRVVGANGVVLSVDHQGRAVDAGDELAHAVLVGEPGGELGRDRRLGVRLERLADRVLALLGGVGLVEHLGEEELEEVLVVRQPVVLVPLVPTLVGVESTLEHLLHPGARRRRRERQGRRDEDHPGDALRMARAEEQ